MSREHRRVPKTESPNTLENNRKDIEGVQEAQNFFRSMGLSIEEDGFVTAHPTTEQINALRTWSLETMGQGGVLMMTEADFYRKTLLAVSLWRQQANETPPYLMGKGAGVEIALRGTVTGRIKRPVEFSYRPHSDFELYGVDYTTAENGANMDSTQIYPTAFQEVLDAQEYFPPTKTKGLKNIPPNLLHATAEIVDFGGVPILVPELELLFLDKYVARESTPRPEGYDAELLARQYVLDRTKIHSYADQFVIGPAIQEIHSETHTTLARHLDAVKRKIQSTKKALVENKKNSSPADVVLAVNNDIQTYLDIQGMSSRVVYAGIRLNLWEPLSPEYVDADDTIIEADYLSRLETKIATAAQAKIDLYNNIHQSLDNLFDRIT